MLTEKIAAFFRKLLLDNNASIAVERTLFLQRSLPEHELNPAAYLLASGVKKAEMLSFLPNEQTHKLADDAFLVAYGVIDAAGNKYLFYENWFHNYTYDRSRLYAIPDWPSFKRHWLKSN